MLIFSTGQTGINYLRSLELSFSNAMLFWSAEIRVFPVFPVVKE